MNRSNPFVALLFVLLAGCDFLPQADRRPPREIYLSEGGIFTGVSPGLSRDGKHIVFAAPAGGLGDIFLYEIETDTVRQLTRSPHPDWSPRWDPSGQGIYYLSERNKRPYLFRFNLDTLEEVQLAKLDSRLMGMGYPSPDGEMIPLVLQVNPLGGMGWYFSMYRFSDGTRTECTPEGVFPWPIEWEDASHFYYVSLDQTMKELEQTTMSNLRVLDWAACTHRDIATSTWETGQTVMLMTVHPESRQFAYVDQHVRAPMTSQLHVRNLDGTQDRIIHQTRYISEMQFSFDGTKIILLQNTDSAGDGEIVIVDLRTGESRVILNTANANRRNRQVITRSGQSGQFD
jgi:Tol biopolymer transport system component